MDGLISQDHLQQQEWSQIHSNHQENNQAHTLVIGYSLQNLFSGDDDISSIKNGNQLNSKCQENDQHHTLAPKEKSLQNSFLGDNDIYINKREIRLTLSARKTSFIQATKLIIRRWPSTYSKYNFHKNRQKLLYAMLQSNSFNLL